MEGLGYQGCPLTLEIPFRRILLNSTYHGRANVWETNRGFGYYFPLFKRDSRGLTANIDAALDPSLPDKYYI
jgi:hypothetical protein